MSPAPKLAPAVSLHNRLCGDGRERKNHQRNRKPLPGTMAQPRIGNPRGSGDHVRRGMGLFWQIQNSLVELPS